MLCSLVLTHGHSFPTCFEHESEAVFTASIKSRVDRGKLVQMAILDFVPNSEQDRQHLIDSVNDVVQKYGVTGIDLTTVRGIMRYERLLTRLSAGDNARR